jgi:hypothetical protein
MLMKLVPSEVLMVIYEGNVMIGWSPISVLQFSSVQFG